MKSIKPLKERLVYRRQAGTTITVLLSLYTHSDFV